MCFAAALAAVCALVYLLAPPFMVLLNNKLMDAIVACRPTAASAARVVIVDIDEMTLDHYGQWPWPRYRLARLLDTIAKRGAAAIALDIVMAEPDRTSLKALQQAIQEEYGHQLDTHSLPPTALDNDAVMAEALSRGPFVLGYVFLFDTQPKAQEACQLHPVNLLQMTRQGAKLGGQGFHQATDVVCNLERFSKAVSYSGFLNGLPDADGILRRCPLILRYGRDCYPSLALAALLQANHQTQLSFRQTPDGSFQLNYEKKRIPVDRHGYLHICFPSGEETVPHISAWDLLRDTPSGADFRDALVFVGLSASGLSTVYVTPSGKRLADVEIQAYLAESILSNRFIYRDNTVLYFEVLLSILLALMYSYCIVRFEMAPVVLIGGVSAFGLWQGSNLLFKNEGILVSPLLPIITIIACGLFLSLYKYWSRQHQAYQSVKEAVVLMKGSERRLNSIIQTIPDIIFRLDTSGRISFISPAMAKYVQDPDQLVGKHILEIVAPDDREMARYHINERRTGKRATADMEMRLLLSPATEDSTNEARYFSVSAEGIYSKEVPDKSSFQGTQGVARDINRRKQLENQLEQSRKMEAIGNLAAGVAHDLNNILSGLVSYPELLLLELPEDSPMCKKIQTIQRSGQRAAAIVQDMLTIARRGVRNSEVINLNEIVIDYLGSPEGRNAIDARPDINLDQNLGSDILNIKGSRVHILKVIMNLINNAAEAMPSGGRVEIATGNLYLDAVYDAYEQIPEGEYVRLRIDDEGVGIPNEDVHRVFEPFFTKKRMGQSGSGLGMTVVWTTVKDHGGFVDIHSQEGIGTRFDIYFPATRELPQTKPRHAALEDYIGNERILVVDDVLEQRQLAVQMLGKLGYAVTSLSSGEQAVAYLQTHTVDLLVLDMVMPPGIDGLETYQRICEINPQQKAIIASGYSESDRVKALQALGAGAYIRKPYTLEKIGMAVRQELDRTR